VPAASAANGLPRAIDAVFGRALSKSPEERHRTAGEFVAALEDALARDERETLVLGTAPVVAARRHVQRAWLVPALLALLLLGGGVLTGAMIASGGGTTKPGSTIVHTVTQTLPGTTVTNVSTVTVPVATPPPAHPPKEKHHGEKPKREH